MYCSVVNAKFINIAVSGTYKNHSALKGYIAVMFQIYMSLWRHRGIYGHRKHFIFSIYLYLYYVKLNGVENFSKI